MDQVRGGRHRSTGFVNDGHSPRGKRHHPQSMHKQWVADGAGGTVAARTLSTSSSGSSSSGGGGGGGSPMLTDGGGGERWERGRGGHHRSGARGRGFSSHGGRGATFRNARLTRPSPLSQFQLSAEAVAVEEDSEMLDGEGEEEEAEEGAVSEMNEPVLDTPEEREKFWLELAKDREIERRIAIAEGKMDDPNVPKRLDQAITLAGTCQDMCPRFERYRRERENNLFELECLPGTKRVDHRRAVKQYERAAGDKSLPSDVRPPAVLRRTLDYLFHDLLPRGGLQKTAAFIRDRSRAVRNDFTLQHETGAIAMECHDRCVRFHILVMHLERDRPGFSYDMEDQQLMNCLQSLKEYYEDQRGRYQSPNELEMRVYHRLIHIRDQRKVQERIPAAIINHAVFKLTTQFRLHVQAKSEPITKKSKLKVDDEAMRIFGELARVLRGMGNQVMCYLVACILERLFGPEEVEDIEALRGDLSLQDIIDGVSREESSSFNQPPAIPHSSSPLRPSATEWLTDNFGPKPTASAIFNSSPQNLIGHGPVGPTAVLPPSVSQGVSSPFNNAFNAHSTSTRPAPSFASPSSESLFGQAAPSVFGSSGLSNAQSAFSIAPQTFGGPSSVTIPTPPPPVPSSFLPPQPTSTTTAPAIPFFAPVETSGVPFGQQTGPTPTTNLPTFSTSKPSSLNPWATSFTPIFPLGVSADANLTTLGAPPVITPSQPDGVSQSIPPPQATDLQQRAQMPALSGAEKDVHFPATRPNPIPNLSSLPKINTDVLDKRAPLPSSPKDPPPLNRQHIISLPPTPNEHPAASSPHASALPSPAFLQTPSSGALSPLLVSTPTTSRPLKAVPSLVLESPTPSSPPPPPLLLALSRTQKKENLAEVEARAIALCRKGWVVKEYFERWVQRATDRAEWMEACEHSEVYKQKVQLERLSNDISPPSERKRPVETHSTPASPIRKRARKRVSSVYQRPLTDEELATRLKENQEEHRHRWARGTFLDVLRSHLQRISKSSPLPSEWAAWVSANPENDGTAIWLECKFDIPASGRWICDSIFSIPLSDNDSSSTHFPGIVIFECTPLKGVADDIEKKYRVLDDCARLRDLAQALPLERHFVPSLLVITWTETDPPELEHDLQDMIVKLQDQGVFGSHHALAMTSSVKNFDDALRDTLTPLQLDVQGKLVERLSLQGIFAKFESAWRDFQADCAEMLFIENDFDWILLAVAIEASVNLLNTMGQIVSLLAGNENPFNPLDGFDPNHVTNAETAFNAIIEWAASLYGHDSTNIAELRYHQDMGNVFPLDFFLDDLYLRIFGRVESVLDRGPSDKVAVIKADIASAVQRFVDEKDSLKVHLRSAQSIRVPRSPRRSSISDESVGTSRQAFGSPEASPMVNGRTSPTPSTVSNMNIDEKSFVTVSMLRALTRSVKEKYKR